MRSVTQVLDGELRSYYLCGICAELYYILCCDWSDGIRDLGDELSDNDVICAVKCPYHKSALNCGDRPDRNDFDLSADTVTGKFRITCECVTGERHTWEADIIEAAKEASNEKN
jgi:hypothetical protein